MIGAEIFFGKWFQAPDLWSLNIYRDVKWKFTVPERYHRDGDGYIVMTKDYYGFRSSHGDHSGADTLVIGGSTTEEGGVDDSETWVQVFSRCMAREGKPVRTLNAGIAGQTILGHIESFRRWFNFVPGLKPKYVIAYVGINEFFVNPNEDSLSKDDRLETVGMRSMLKKVRLHVKSNSSIYRLYRVIKGNIIALASGIHPLNYKLYPPGHANIRNGEDHMRAFFRRSDLMSIDLNGVEAKKFRSLTRFNTSVKISALNKRLTSLRNEILNFGAEPVLITQRSGDYRIRGNRLLAEPQEHEAMNYFWFEAVNTAIMNFCKMYKMTCVDLGARIRFGDGDFYDQFHTTPAGSLKVGEFICRALVVNPKFEVRNLNFPTRSLSVSGDGPQNTNR